jgi:hypothetical protein
MIEGAPLASVRWITPENPRWSLASTRHLSRPPRRAAAVAWLPVEVVLASRKLSSLIVAAVTLGVAAVCVRDGGPDKLIVNVPALAVIWSAAYGLIRLGRGWRGVRPSSQESRLRVSSTIRWQGAMAAGGRDSAV